MRKSKIVFWVILIIIFLSMVGLFLIGYFRPKGAGLLINSKPEATVYIDGQAMGQTPQEITRKPGEILLKLIPNILTGKIEPFETKLILVSGIKTVVEHDFGGEDSGAQSYTISFEKIGTKDVELAVVSIPDAALVLIDSQKSGFTPHKTASITEGEHTLTISFPGYLEKSLNIRTYEGYKLTAFVRLARAKEEIKEKPEEVKKEEKPEIEILSTPTGFLRVREEPSSQAIEIGKVEPGETFELLEEDETGEWFKIEFEQGKNGWVSAKYTKKIEVEENKEENPTI